MEWQCFAVERRNVSFAVQGVWGWITWIHDLFEVEKVRMMMMEEVDKTC